MKYGYANAINVFCDIPTENARRILPAHLEPLERMHGVSVFSMIAFDFTESVVGPYREVVMSIAVAPLIEPGTPIPKAAFHPYLVATTTADSRQHGEETWHLPHWKEDVEIEFSDANGSISAAVAARGSAVMEMTVHHHRWQPASHDYQGLIQDESGAYITRIVMEGMQSEHEEERGSLTIHPHEFNDALDVDEISDIPFREIWMRAGQQVFAPLARDLRRRS